MQTQLSTPMTFDPENKFVTSYLISPAVLGCVRLLFGTYALTANIVVLIWAGVVSHDADTYFSYFTHLSYIGVTAWLWAGGVQSIAFASVSRSGGHPRYPLQSWPRAFQFLHELLFSTVVTFPFIVTIVYWSLIASPESFSTPFNAWSNISQHILNTVFVYFEITCTNVPTLNWIHLATTIVILGLYLGVAYITHATQGFYPYDFLDPKKQGAFLVVYIIGIAVGQVVMFLVVRYAIILRERVVKKEDRIQHIPLGESIIRKKTATIHDPTYLPGGEYNLQETRPFMNA